MQHSNDNNINCNVVGCSETFAVRNELISHLKKHIKSGLTVQCPIDSCEKFFHNISSLTSHISRCHNILQERISVHHKDVHLTSPNEDNSNQSVEISSEDCQKSSLYELSLFYIMLFVKFHVPNTTIQLIFDEFAKLQNQNFTEFYRSYF